MDYLLMVIYSNGGGLLHHRPHRLLLDDSNGTRPRNSLTNESNFDTNMVIILAALLCTAMCSGVELDLALRVAMWQTVCSRDSQRNCSTSDGKRIEEERVAADPVAVYGPGMNLKATDCPICLGEFMDGEKNQGVAKIASNLFRSFAGGDRDWSPATWESSGGQADVPAPADEVG
ncbi:hypothetical protein F3Y22_tig00110933pilonHSYRG00050 [Hibiscus syriacus]|uniref:RING-type E3 ubiquitin transferase n=1 Tax=Hibiscus syriacus TaxID=106335 RepID=A0A6A2ZDQ2_HIBSY|nr:hypothetical protein F3Y22_tig00110933pilonHSYRG00050 [Hibiscus syriacus]